MNSPTIIISRTDLDVLNGLVQAYEDQPGLDSSQAEQLDQLLQGAEIRLLTRMPDNVVRMRSQVQVFDCASGKEETYTLVLPREASISHRQLSVLAPLGIALLGRRKGKVVKAQAPGGVRTLRIVDVFHGVQRSPISPSVSRSTEQAPPAQSELAA